MGYSFQTKDDLPITKVLGRGRRRGNGQNLIFLRRMKPGSPLWNVPLKKAMSIKHSAWRFKIKIKIRRLPTGLYGIWKL